MKTPKKTKSPKRVAKNSESCSLDALVSALAEGFTGTKTFKGIDTGEVKLPSGGRMRLAVGTITVSNVESERFAAHPPMTPDILHDSRLLLLDVMEDVASIATLLREGCETMENGEHTASNAQACASDAADATTDAVNKLRAIALKCEEFAS